MGLGTRLRYPPTATAAAPELEAARFQSSSTTNPMNVCTAGDSSAGSSQSTRPRGARPFWIDPIVIEPLRKSMAERHLDRRRNS